jgi:2-haloacid dehalogenase
MAHFETLTHPKLLLVDVYDTLLRMDDVERKVNQLLNSRFGYALWFELFMQYCFVDNCIIQFNDFASIARATMQMTAGMMRKDIGEQDVQQVLDLLKQLPVHEGVQEGLSSLNDLGLRLVALTNSPEITVNERMNRTGLISYFAGVLSAEHVGKYKPSLAVYKWALQKFHVQPADAILVSTHGWDLAGANNAGMKTAYIKQAKQMLYPLAPTPDYICNSLNDLAQQLSVESRIS